jgi:NAD+ kinase
METALPDPRTIRRAVVVSTKFKPEAHDLAREIAATLGRRGIETVLDLAGELDLSRAAAGAALLVAVGGDGTILGTARSLAGLPVPTMGINIGKLGFLAEFSADDLRRYLEGGPPPGRIVPRLMLRCRCRAAGAGDFLALNDAVITQGPMARILAIEMRVDGGRATRYNADGVVVSTPVGSTAYSLSLGGPILTPGADAMIVTPIAPHSLTNRPLVLEGASRLSFRVMRESPSLALVLDGQEMMSLDVGAEIEIARAERPFLLATHNDRSFFDLLRAKFHWGEPPAYAPPPPAPAAGGA